MQIKKNTITAFTLLVLLSLLFTPFIHAQEEKVFVLMVEEDHHEEDHPELVVKELYVKAGIPTPKHEKNPGSYRFEIVSFDDTILYESFISISDDHNHLPALSGASEEDLEREGVTQEQIKEDARLEEESKGVDSETHADPPKIVAKEEPVPTGTLRIPYFKNAREILFYSPEGEKLFSKSTTQFADTCGNSKCEKHESYGSCASDCESGVADDFCDNKKDGKCDPDCLKDLDADCESGKTVDQVQYEKRFVCNYDGYCSGGETRGNCPADCGSPRGKYLVAVVVIFSLIVAVSAFRSRDKGGFK